MTKLHVYSTLSHNLSLTVVFTVHSFMGFTLQCFFIISCSFLRKPNNNNNNFDAQK